MPIMTSIMQDKNSTKHTLRFRVPMVPHADRMQVTTISFMSHYKTYLIRTKQTLRQVRLYSCMRMYIFLWHVSGNDHHADRNWL